MKLTMSGRMFAIAGIDEAAGLFFTGGAWVDEPRWMSNEQARAIAHGLRARGFRCVRVIRRPVLDEIMRHEDAML